jgi:alpha-glucosidase
MQYVGEKEIDEVKMNVYFCDGEANSFIFEDYGETFAYEQDIYLEKKFAATGNAQRFIIQQSMEGLYTPRYENYHLNIIGLPFKPTRIIADNSEVRDFVVASDKTVQLKLRKNFAQLVIS